MKYSYKICALNQRILKLITPVISNKTLSRLGTIFILRKGIGVGGPENGNFPLLYVMKMSLHRGVGGSKKPQNTLT